MKYMCEHCNKTYASAKSCSEHERIVHALNSSGHSLVELKVGDDDDKPYFTVTQISKTDMDAYLRKGLDVPKGGDSYIAMVAADNPAAVHEAKVQMLKYAIKDRQDYIDWHLSYVRYARVLILSYRQLLDETKNALSALPAEPKPKKRKENKNAVQM